MTDTLLLHCSGCGRQLSVPKSLIGRRFRCPGCKAVTRAEEPRPGPAEVIAEHMQSPLKVGPEAWSESTHRRLIVGTGVVLFAILISFPFWLYSQHAERARAQRAEAEADEAMRQRIAAMRTHQDAPTPSPAAASVSRGGNIRTGGPAKLRATGGDPWVPMGATLDDLTRAKQLFAARDTRGLAEMARDGKLIMEIENRTRVTVIDFGPFNSEVRIEEGPAAGRSGWVSTDWIEAN